jgi:hypothetical protein
MACERIRSGLSPTTTRTSAAVSAPIPNASTSSGSMPAGEFAQEPVVVLDLVVQGEPAAGQGAQGAFR